MSAKPQFQPDINEFETRDAAYDKKARTVRIIESIRLGLLTLALLAGVTILGTSADTLAVYNKTHIGENFFLPLSGVWPSEFDLRPTIALVTCGSIISIASAASLISSKISSIRYNPVIHSSSSFVASTICLFAGLIGMSFFYGVNRSNTVFSLQAWTCQWSDVSMTSSPHWGTLCKESKVALYLTVMIVPLEVLILASSAYVSSLERKQLIMRERKGSPAMS